MNNGSSKGLSIAALVCGIFGLVGGWIPIPGLPFVALLAGIAGIVLGAIAMKKAKANGEPKGLATAGLVCGIIGTALALIAVICVVCLASVVATGFNAAANGELNSALGELSSILG